jgi:hypothetical protein
MQKLFCFNILLSADKNAKNQELKFWNAQFERLRQKLSPLPVWETLYTHTASEGTRLVWQWSREFFLKFCFGVFWGPCQLLIFSQIFSNGQFGRLRQKLSSPPVREIQFRLILHLKAQDLFDNELESFLRNFDSASLGGHVNLSLWA